VEIAALAERIGQKISVTDATLRIHEILERGGLKVQVPGAVSRINFEIIGYSGGKPKVLVAIKHAETALELAGQAKQFLGRVQRIHASAPDAMGWFVADGNIDTEVLATLANPRINIFSFDLTQKDVLSQIVATLDQSVARSNKGPSGESILKTARLRE
jgi:hypothetical protein